MAAGWQRKPDNAAAAARKAKYNRAEHKEAERQIKAAVARGEAWCWRCGKPLNDSLNRHGQRTWHVGHDDHQLGLIRGGECSSCNLTAAGIKGNRISNAARLPESKSPSRQW